MKRFYVILLVAVMLSATAFAQKGNNQVGGGVEVSFPTGDFGDAFKAGPGLYVKGLYGIGTAGQVTFTTGYSAFKLKGSDDDYKIIARIIPLLAGYRHHFNGFFAEPQLGYGIYGFKVKGDEVDTESDSEGAFTWALTGGYIFNKQIEVSVRFQSAHKDGGSQSLFGLRVGYNFSAGSSR